MAPTHSGATAPVRAQGPARYSVLEHGLRNNVGLRLKGVVWDGGSLTRIGGSSRQAGAGSHNQVRVGVWMGVLPLASWRYREGGQAVIF